MYLILPAQLYEAPSENVIPHPSVKLDDIISPQYSTICNIKKHDMTGAASEGGTVYPSGAPEFTHGFLWGTYCSMFCFSICFLLVIVFLSFELRILITPFWYLQSLLSKIYLKLQLAFIFSNR